MFEVNFDDEVIVEKGSRVFRLREPESCVTGKSGAKNVQVDGGPKTQLRAWNGDIGIVGAVSGIEEFVSNATYCEDDRRSRRVGFYLASQRMDMNIERMFL